MKKILIAALCLMLGCLTACKGGASTEAGRFWKAAAKADSMEAYVEEHAEDLDLETLKAEAGADDASLSQQFQAVALLCAAEYQGYLSTQEGSVWEDDFFTFDYPVSASYADSYFAKVNTEGEEFWTSMKEAFYPYDCLMPMFGAAGNLEGQTLVNLLQGEPDDSTLGTEIEDAVEEWIRMNPGKLAAVGDALLENGYFDDWSLDDWKQTYFYSSNAPYQIEVPTLEDGLNYLTYVKNTILPAVEGKHGADSFQSPSKLTQEDFYHSELAVTVAEEITLQEPGEGLPETIDTEGKKVIGLYRNMQTEEFEGSPTALRVMGDFMLELSEEEYPASLAEADYYLVLTANYEAGEFYQTYGGSETEIQQIDSSTSVDLYEAGTGTFLRHLGNVLETPPESIYTSYDDNAARYAEMTGADVLTFMYHNINDPEAYSSLVDHLAGKSECAIGEPVNLAGWEITYHSAEILKEFESGMYIYTASDGCQFVRGSFTIANKGMEADTFLPMVYYIGEDPIVQVTDEAHEEFYDCVNAITYNKCLNNSSLEPGESKDGELLFEIPDEMAQSGEALYIAVSLGNRKAYYPLS